MLDAVCRRWPGYTLSSVLEEDASLLYQTVSLLDPDLGKAPGPVE